MFHISILVLILCHQVVFSNSYECSPIAIKGEKCTITRRVSPNSLIWNKDGTSILSSTYQATNTCLPSAPNTEYATYCLRDPSNYIFILELINPEKHAGSTFSDGASGLTTTINLMEPDSPNITINSINPITEDMFIVSVRVSCCKPQPTKFIWNFNASKSTIPYTIESTQTSTDNTGCTSSLLNRESSRSVNLNDWDPEITNTDGDIDISVGVKFGEGKTVNSSPVTVQYISQGSPSSPPTPSTSTSLQPTSSAPNPSTKVSSESSTSSNPTPTPPCVNLICDCDKICIIISVCVGSLIVIVVIVLCCCCCPFCPCYKRKGTGCKFCCKKKTSDRNSNSNKTKRASRPEQYEMPRANQSDQMHSYSDYHVSRPDQRARASDTGFPHPNDSRYGQGYNNAAFVYPGENERRSNKDRKPRVIQRPYTNHYS